MTLTQKTQTEESAYDNMYPSPEFCNSKIKYIPIAKQKMYALRQDPQKVSIKENVLFSVGKDRNRKTEEMIQESETKTSE